MPVGNAHDSVFAPTIGARSGMIIHCFVYCFEALTALQLPKRLFCYKSSGPEMPVAWTRTSASPGTSCEMGASSYFRNSGPPRPWIRTTFMVEGMKVDCVIPLDSTLLAPVCTDTSTCKRRATGCVPDVL